MKWTRLQRRDKFLMLFGEYSVLLTVKTLETYESTEQNEWGEVRFALFDMSQIEFAFNI